MWNQTKRRLGKIIYSLWIRRLSEQSLFHCKIKWFVVLTLLPISLYSYKMCFHGLWKSTVCHLHVQFYLQARGIPHNEWQDSQESRRLGKCTYHLLHSLHARFNSGKCTFIRLDLHYVNLKRNILAKTENIWKIIVAEIQEMPTLVLTN